MAQVIRVARTRRGWVLQEAAGGALEAAVAREWSEGEVGALALRVRRVVSEDEAFWVAVQGGWRAE